MPDPRPLTAIVCDHDPLVLRATAAALTEAGYEVLNEASNAIEAIRQNEMFTPSLVVITHEQIGLSGLEAIPDLRAVDPPPEVLLIAYDAGRVRDHAKAEGAHDAAEAGDGPMLDRMIAEITHVLKTGERRSHNDRRSGEDRRVKQDWSKVTTERRKGGDRRQEARREDGDGS